MLKDVIHIACMIGISRQGFCTCGAVRNGNGVRDMLSNIFLLIISAGLLAYLVAAMLWPEKC